MFVVKPQQIKLNPEKGMLGYRRGTSNKIRDSQSFNIQFTLF